MDHPWTIHGIEYMDHLALQLRRQDASGGGPAAVSGLAALRRWQRGGGGGAAAAGRRRQVGRRAGGGQEATGKTSKSSNSEMNCPIPPMHSASGPHRLSGRWNDHKPCDFRPSLVGRIHGCVLRCDAVGSLREGLANPAQPALPSQHSQPSHRRQPCPQWDKFGCE